VVPDPLVLEVLDEVELDALLLADGSLEDWVVASCALDAAAVLSWVGVEDAEPESAVEPDSVGATAAVAVSALRDVG